MAKGNFTDLTGMRFERLTVIRRHGIVGRGNVTWFCQCDCGNTTTSPGFCLKNGESKSCGCLTAQQLIARVTKHGLSTKPEWRVWVGMRQRCDNPTVKRYHRYGGRDIRYCERWRLFENFYADMGPRPSKEHTLERKDYDGNYEPSNCVWATKEEQNHNKCNNHYVVYRGERMTLTKAVEISGNDIDPGTVFGRIKRKWDVQRAIEQPPHALNWRHIRRMSMR